MAGNAEGVFLNALFATKWAEIKALWWIHRSNPLVSLSPLLPRRMNPSESHNYIFAAGHWDTPRHPTQTPPRRAPNASLTGSPCGTSITVKHSAPPGKLAILCFPSHTHQPLHPTTTAPAPFVRPLTLAVLNWAKSKFNISRGGGGVGGGVGVFKKQPAESSKSDHSCDLRSGKNTHMTTLFSALLRSCWPLWNLKLTNQ